MDDYSMSFRVHAIQRMFQRGITEVDVRILLETGEVIEEYPDELPYPSRLILGVVERRPIHVVVALDHEARCAIIVTVYEPDPSRWDLGFRRRKHP
jgi:hypothetical protein